MKLSEGWQGLRSPEWRYSALAAQLIESQGSFLLVIGTNSSNPPPFRGTVDLHQALRQTTKRKFEGLRRDALFVLISVIWTAAVAGLLLFVIFAR